MPEEISQESIDNLRKLRDTPIRNKRDLDNYLRVYHGVYLAKKSIEEGNSNPLNFVWDIYSTAMFGKQTDIYNFLGVATRGGQKSLSCGSLETVLLTHDKYRDFFHMASIKQQSKVTYNYVQGFYRNPILSETVEKCIMSETRTRYNKQLIIGTGTMDSVNSFHGSTIQDEVDLTPAAVFKESKGMLTAQSGRLALNVCISSRKFSFGNVQRLLDSSKRKNFPLKVHMWSILEVTEKCGDKRSGEYGYNYYIDEDNLIALTEEEYANISNPEKEFKYEKTVGYRNCAGCGLFSFCKGNLKKQDDDNPYLQPIEQVRNLFFTDDPFFFLSQRLNKKPSSKGLIFPMWDEEAHVRTYNQMYKILTGNDYPDKKEMTLEEMVAVFLKYKCRSFTGEDFGFNNARALLAFVDGSDRVYIIDEIAVSGLSDNEFACECRDQWEFIRRKVENGFPDIASPGGVKEFSKYFRMVQDNTVYNKLSKIPEFRAGWVRKKLKAGGTKLVSLFVHPNCGELRSEMPFYHYVIDPKTEESTDRIEKKNDHSVDALGNILVGVFALESEITVALSTTEEVFMDDRGKLLKPPNAVEMAKMLGRENEFFDNRNSEDEDDEINTSDVTFDFA